MSTGTVIDQQWARVRGRLREEVGEAAYRSWLKPLTLADVDDGAVRISVPTRFMRDWVLAHFADRLRAALRDLTRPDRLRHNPLLRSRLVSARVRADAGPAERTNALRAAVQEAAAVLKSSPRDAAAFRALHRAYLQPAPSHEKAAELLSLPSSTFRRHLSAGVARLTEILWQEELDA